MVNKEMNFSVAQSGQDYSKQVKRLRRAQPQSREKKSVSRQSVCSSFSPVALTALLEDGQEVLWPSLEHLKELEMWVKVVLRLKPVQDKSPRQNLIPIG